MARKIERFVSISLGLREKDFNKLLETILLQDDKYEYLQSRDENVLSLPCDLRVIYYDDGTICLDVDNISDIDEDDYYAGETPLGDLIAYIAKLEINYNLNVNTQINEGHHYLEDKEYLTYGRLINSEYITSSEELYPLNASNAEKFIKG